MAVRLRISIRSKILLVLSVVVVAAVALYLYLASKLFYEDKTLLVYELNQTNVRTLGEETETYLKRLLDRMRILATLAGRQGKTAPSVARLFSAEEEGILRIALLRREKGGATRTQVLNLAPSTLDLDAKDVTFLNQLRARYPIPYSEVLKQKTWVRNVTIPSASNGDSLAVMTIAGTVPGSRDIVFADVKLDYLLKAVSRGGIAELYIADSNGSMLAHPTASKVLQAESMLEDPLVQTARGAKMRSEVKQFEVGGKKFLGSFYRLGTGGVVVASKIESEEAFVAARVLFQKSLWYALMTVTAAFLVALFLSHSLTVPIRRLVDATRRIAQGDFKSMVRVSTGDELALLAASFNSMTSDLDSSLEKLKNTQQQLIHSERMAAVGQVARSIGHEFGNILLAIVGNADLAMISKEPEKVQRNLQTILQAADRASNIVKNLQSFSKANPNRVPTEPVALIRATMSLINHETRKHSVEVVEKIGTSRKVNVNAAEVEQVLLNLTINAMHAMPNGGQIEIGCEDRGDDVVIWVKDSGTGIPPEVLPRIFDFAFTTKGEKGSGLGLAISKQIVEGHEGSLRVETELGKGTTFTVELPGVTENV